MGLDVAEVWTGPAGRYERAAGVPHRGRALLALGRRSCRWSPRAGVSGGTWLEVWMPSARRAEGGAGDARRAGGARRRAARPDRGDARPDGATRSTRTRTRSLTELARQVGLALHNVQLDSALQESLDEVRRQRRAAAVPRPASSSRRRRRAPPDRARPPRRRPAAPRGARGQAAPGPRRSSRTIRDAATGDARPSSGATSRRPSPELRSLAHGIYPPLLVARGLAEALAAAAGPGARSRRRVVADGVGRYPQDVEAARLLLLPRGDPERGQARRRRGRADRDGPRGRRRAAVQVADDGAGFDMTEHDGDHSAHQASAGHGFVNMSDRLGAVGGRVHVTSRPGQGTTVAGGDPARLTGQGRKPSCSPAAQSCRTTRPPNSSLFT